MSTKDNPSTPPSPSGPDLLSQVEQALKAQKLHAAFGTNIFDSLEKHRGLIDVVTNKDILGNLHKVLSPPTAFDGLDKLSSGIDVAANKSLLDSIYKVVSQPTVLDNLDKISSRIGIAANKNLADSIHKVLPQPSALDGLHKYRGLTDTTSNANTIANLTSAQNALEVAAGSFKSSSSALPLPARIGSKTDNNIVSSVEALGKIIRQKRKAMRMTQQQFADITGVGRRFISELEAGKSTLEFGRVLKVTQAIGIDLIAVAR